MKQRIIVSGLGGQGVLFLTRVIAEAAVQKGFDVLTSETHGMAQRGGSVISTIKIGDFQSPLLRGGQADFGFFLHDSNLDVHGGLMAADGKRFINSVKPGAEPRIDASGLARDMGAPVLANLILLGFAVRQGGLFCNQEDVEQAVRALSHEKFVAGNLEGLRRGLQG